MVTSYGHIGEVEYTAPRKDLLILTFSSIFASINSLRTVCSQFTVCILTQESQWDCETFLETLQKVSIGSLVWEFCFTLL